MIQNDASFQADRNVRNCRICVSFIISDFAVFGKGQRRKRGAAKRKSLPLGRLGDAEIV
jgi:hypothetical protein